MKHYSSKITESVCFIINAVFRRKN